ncbi:MAG TPA: HEAT repeat domain-containing protein [Isosphaeraceae bacterium]|jgi:hypothetical protein|nr:HEAT repeat domain-containing protein [Isosphaeraceae bacterium]
MVGMISIARPRIRVILSMSIALVVAGECRADRIVLRGGTQIRGVVLPSPANQPNQVLVLTEALTTPIKYRKDQVTEVITEPSALKDYLVKRDQTDSSAQAQYDLGLWCEHKKLLSFADLHYRQAAESDKNFAPAHKKLGHVQYADRWVTTDELKVAQGLTKVKGKWVTQEEKAKIESDVVSVKERGAWQRRLKVLRNSLLFGSTERRQDAETQLAAIQDPNAVQPLIQAFSEDPDDVRTFLVRIVAGIPGPEATSGLISRLLAEAEQSVRQATLEELARRDDPQVVTQLVKSLKSKNLAVVNRAAWALGNLNAVTTVPKLVPALVAVDERMIWVPSNSGSSGGGIGVGFTSSVSGNLPPPVGAVGPIPPALPGPVPVVGMSGYNPYYGASSVAVGPGVVAFGGATYPMTTGSGFSLSTGSDGGGGPVVGSGMQPKMIRNTYQNIEVLNALHKLTGKNFGYDTDAWRHWLNTSYRPDPTPARRVPQP